MKYILSAILTLLSYSSFEQQQTFIDSVEQTIANTKEELIKIKDGYYVIQPDGIAGNIGVYVDQKGVVLIDDQWSELIPRIKELIKTITDKPISYIINTHFHFDHVDGNKVLAKENIPIIAHKNIRERLTQNRVINGIGLQKAYPVDALPSITFNDSMKLYRDEEIINLVHYPNVHTDGDVIVHFEKADIYHTGDIFVTYGLPIIDENNGGDIYNIIRTVNYLLSVSDSGTRFIPGHGPICTVKELSAYDKLLTSIKDQVVNMMKEGLTLEKISDKVIIDKNVFAMDKKGFISHVYRMALKHEKIGMKKKST